MNPGKELTNLIVAYDKTNHAYWALIRSIDSTIDDIGEIKTTSLCPFCTANGFESEIHIKHIDFYEPLLYVCSICGFQGDGFDLVTRLFKFTIQDTQQYMMLRINQHENYKNTGIM